MGLGKARRKQAWRQHASACDLRSISSQLTAAAAALPTDRTLSKSTLTVPYSQRRVKSNNTLLNSNGHHIKRMPSHIMPELLYDLSRSSSHISIDLSSSDDESYPKESAKSARHMSAADACSKVTPNAPKVIILTPKSTESQSKSATNVSIKRNSENPDEDTRSAQTINSTYRILVPRQNLLRKKTSYSQSAFDQNWKDLSGTDSLPSQCQIRTSSNVNSMVRQLSRNTRPGSVEDFMQDATVSLTRDEYDPYGLVRRNFSDWFSDCSRAQSTNVTPDSRTSSGQFSLSSNQSMHSTWTIPRAIDRRRRQKPKFCVTSAAGL